MSSDPNFNIAQIIGLFGLVPFVACTALIYSGLSDISVVALFSNAIYGAVILSFVGAIHWGLAMREDRSPYWYIWSIIPTLSGWLAIVFLDIRISLLVLSVAFTLAWTVDRHAHKLGLIPNWYMRLRHLLTVGATISLLATAFAATSS